MDVSELSTERAVQLMPSTKKKHWNKLSDAKTKKGDGRQRHFRGKMTLPGGSPRAHTHGGHSQADAGYTTSDCPSGKGSPPGRYRVSAPLKRWQRHGIMRNATTGERVA